MVFGIGKKEEVELKPKQRRVGEARCSEVAEGVVNCSIKIFDKKITVRVNKKENTAKVISDDYKLKNEGFF
ncbi:MAG: hypothetical protein ACOCQD_01825 [archaeon]